MFVINIYPIISVILTLCSVPSTLLAWSVKETSTEEDSVLTMFIIVKECGEIFIKLFICNKSKQKF